MVAGLLAAADAASAPSSDPAGTESPLLEPDRVLITDPGVYVHRIALSPDGRTAVAAVELKSMNLWAVAAHFWPEALGGLIVLLCLWALRRALRGGMAPGEEHCRRCLYPLRGLTAPRCPECGLELTPGNRRVAGSRVVPVALAGFVAAFTAGYYGLYRDDFTRRGPFSEWFSWEFGRAYEWMKDTRLAWSPYLVERSAIVELDMETGATTRVIIRSERADRSWGSEVAALLVSPDGGSFFRLVFKTVTQHDRMTGAESARMPGRPQYAPFALSWVDGGRRIAVDDWFGMDPTSLWDPRTNEVDPAVRTSFASTGQVSPPVQPWKRPSWEVRHENRVKRAGRYAVRPSLLCRLEDGCASFDGRRIALVDADRRTIFVLDTSEHAEELRVK
jgi:hypothetical protein